MQRSPSQVKGRQRDLAARFPRKKKEENMEHIWIRYCTGSTKAQPLAAEWWSVEAL